VLGELVVLLLVLEGKDLEEWGGEGRREMKIGLKGWVGEVVE
jgi:hypothetical protein